MKSLHKKISVIVLTLLCLSQGFVVYATPRILGQYLLKNPKYTLASDDTFLNFIDIANNQVKYNYDALYLGEYDKFIQFIEKYGTSKNGKHNLLYPKRGEGRHYLLEPGIPFYYYLIFKNNVDFLIRVGNNVLGPYRGSREGIIIRVGDSLFKILFHVTNHERNTLPMKILAKEYNFNVGYANGNDFYGIYEIESHLNNRNDLKKNPDLVAKLKKGPLKENVNKFENIEMFVYSLMYGNHQIPNILTRYRIGSYDFIIKNNN